MKFGTFYVYLFLIIRINRDLFSIDFLFYYDAIERLGVIKIRFAYSSTDNIVYIEWYPSKPTSSNIQSYQLNVHVSGSTKLSVYKFYNDGTSKDVLWVI